MNSQWVNQVKSVIASDSVRIVWSDESESIFQFIWLRDNCACEKCGSHTSGSRFQSFLDIPKRRLRITARHVMGWALLAFPGVSAHCVLLLEHPNRLVAAVGYAQECQEKIAEKANTRLDLDKVLNRRRAI